MHPTQSKILIVDDAHLDLRIVERLIRSMGHQPVPVTDGGAALAAIETSRPDLILLDIVLPGLDGYDVLQRLKQDPILCSIPVIMLSSRDKAESVVKCIHQGAHDYITKPFWPQLLKTRINNVLEKQQASLDAEQLGRYTIDEKIGEGGMADVYLARHALLRRPTAVKVLMKEMVSEENLAMFEREVQITSKLTHPNTIVIFDYGRTSEGCFYYAMEYLDGISLQTLIDSSGPIPEERVIYILKQVCLSLSEAHSNNLIHRDIKPSNIMLCNRGGEFDVVKVLDFGIVQSMKEEEDSPQRPYMMGTPAYMSPESLRADTVLDGRSDLYSLALVGFMLLTGKGPFNYNIDCLQEIIDAQLHESPEAPSVLLGNDISPDLDQLILKCLEKEMTKRPASARSLYESLDRCQSSQNWTQNRAEEWWAGREYRRGSSPPGESTSRTSVGTVSIDLMSPRTQILLEQSP